MLLLIKKYLRQSYLVILRKLPKLKKNPENYEKILWQIKIYADLESLKIHAVFSYLNILSFKLWSKFGFMFL